MNLKYTLLAAALLTGCGGDEPAKTPAPAPAPAQKADAAPDLKPWREALADADYVKYGEQVFMAKGSNTCNDCHGKDGKKGRLEQAADLTQPETWDVTKATGGDKAKIDTALMYLVSNGGKKFNENFAKDNPDIGWDWSKTDGDSYDIQMFGVTQSSTMSALKKIRKGMKKAGIGISKDDLTEFGAKSVLAYVDSLAASPATK